MFRKEEIYVKPLGTITMCFPHVDEDTRNTLKSVMEIAKNYADFTDKLCNRICEEPSPLLLQYFAIFFAFHIEWYTPVDRLQSAGKVPDLALPIVLLIKGRRAADVSWEEMKEAMQRALELTPNDWITCHLYLAWRFKAEILYPECDVDIRPIDTIAARVSENRDLAFFKAYLIQFEALGYLRENKRVEATDKLKQALAVARKFDDQVLMVDYLLELASNIKHTDMEIALHYLTVCKEIGEELGYKDRVGAVHHQLGHIRGIRGEMNAAIESQLEYKAIRESLGLPTEYMSTVIAFLYNQIGNGEMAFEHAKIILDFEDSVLRHLPYTRAQLSWSLINLGRLGEAKAELAAAQKAANKSGDIRQIIWVRLVEGILDKAEGSLDSASGCFSEVMNYTEENPLPVIQNICLLNLSEIEIELLTTESFDVNLETSGPWMQKLMKHVEMNDFSGIAARALLLKAELRKRQGRTKDVRKILKEVIKTATNPSMRYLEDIAVAMFPEILTSRRCS